MKIYATVLVLVLASLAAVPAASADAPLAERLPAGSLLYAGWAGRSLPFDGSNFGQMLQEPTIKQLFGVIKKKIDETKDENAAHAWALAEIVWQHPIAFSLMDLVPARGGPPKVAAVLLIDLGKDQPAFAKHLDVLIANSGIPVVKTTVGHVACRTVSTPLGTFTLGYKGNMLFLTVGDQTAQKVLSVKPAGSLKADKAFIARRKGVSGDNEQCAWSIDLKTLQPKISNLFEAMARPGVNGPGKTPAESNVVQIIKALGLGKITSASGATRIVDKGLHTKTRIMSPAPHSGVLMLMAGGNLTPTDLSGAPDDAIIFCAAKLSAASVYAEILEVAKRIKPDADKEIRREVGRIEDQLGLSLSKDILANLGDTWTLTSASSLGGLGTGTVLSVSVKDEAKLKVAIGKLEAFFGKQIARVSEQSRRYRYGRVPSLESVKYGKLEVHYLQNALYDIPLAPAWAVAKGKLHIGLWPQVVAAAIEADGKKSLVRSAAFQKLRGRVSAKPSSLTYVDTPAIVRNFYNLLLLGWTAGANELTREFRGNLKARVDWLPALSKIEKYLSPEISAVSADATGLTIESYGSVPIISNYMTSALTVAPVGAAILVPAVMRARVLAQEASSRAHLKGIGTAIAMYMGEDENGQSPPGMVTLVEKGLITAEALVSPVSGRRMPTDRKGLPIGKSDYVYIVHGRNSAGSMIRVYELPENYGNRGTIVLMVDGSVRWMDMPAFKALLAKSLQQAHK